MNENAREPEGEMVTQEEVTQFYERLVFPSTTSHAAYEKLVTGDLKGLRVGDFGCGRSLFIDVFRRLNYDAVFLDISRNALKTINYGERIRASLTDIPLKDDYMDVIYCIGVVHHIPEMDKAISELCRVLKKNGRLYLGVYASRSVPASLRKLHNAAGGALTKKIVYHVSGLLIWMKNRKNGLKRGSAEHRKRIDDLLLTPLVRYLPPKEYSKLLVDHGFSVTDLKRISSMNIIIAQKI